MEPRQESANLDIGRMKPEQVDLLRSKLRQFATGKVAADAEVGVVDVACCHSSHFDNDGWW